MAACIVQESPPDCRLPHAEEEVPVETREESITRRVDLVSGLVWSSLPGTQPDTASNAERWKRVAGPALLAKATTTVESMTLLLPARKATDSLVLLRALYENVVDLAWIAGNPTYRLNRLYSEFYIWHLRENEDWATGGRPILSSEEIAECKEWLRAHPKHLPHIYERASVADRTWGGRFEGWHNDGSDAADQLALSSLRGLGRYIWRRGSQAIHSHHRGLDPFMVAEDERLGPRREAPPDSLLVWELGVRLLLFAIGPAFKTLGWPSFERARAIVTSTPDDAMSVDAQSCTKAMD
jgi:Family of unknown function (DUF5677)